MHETVEKIAREFFTLMGIEVEDVVAETEDEKRRIFRVTVKTPDSKLLIGVHGQTLEHLRHLVGRLAERATGSKSVLVHLEVNDYLQSKDRHLFRRIDERVESLLRTGGETALDPELSSYDRKKIHAYVSEKGIEGLTTKSVGEGMARCLHLVYSGAPRKEPSHPVASRMDGSDLSEDGIGI